MFGWNIFFRLFSLFIGRFIAQYKFEEKIQVHFFILLINSICSVFDSVFPRALIHFTQFPLNSTALKPLRPRTITLISELGTLPFLPTFPFESFSLSRITRVLMNYKTKLAVLLKSYFACSFHCDISSHLKLYS